jgi:hypothetical protein
MPGSHTPTSVGHPQEPDRGLQLVSAVSHGLPEQLAGAVDGHLATTRTGPTTGTAPSTARSPSADGACR